MERAADVGVLGRRGHPAHRRLHRPRGPCGRAPHPQLALFGCGLAGLLGALACLGLEWGWLREASNALGPLAERIPCYPALTAAYGTAGLLAYAAAGTAIVRGRRRNARPSGTALGVASLAYLAGLFAVRFGFYMTHMTVGIG